MLRNLSHSILTYERVKTTEAKAKEVRVFVDRMINLGKDGSLPARRRALAWLQDPVLVHKLFTDLPPRYADRTAGYARITRINRRVGDAAPQMLVELLPGLERPTEGAKAAAEATEEKPRRRIGLPRRRAKKIEEEPEAKAEPEKTTTRKRTTTTTKKKTTKKGAAT
jgi:large subunit ribosomal protein L17